MSALASSIENLYRAFAIHRKPTVVAGCPCCVGNSDQSRLHVAPLRALSADDLGRYVFKAMTTWGTVADFKHFLPRVFELAVEGELWVDTQTICGKLSYGNWSEWPDTERGAIQELLRTWWERERRTSGAGECLESISCVEADLGPYLNGWREAESVDAVVAFVCDNSSALRSNQLVGPWWSDRSRIRLIEWLHEPATTSWLASVEHARVAEVLEVLASIRDPSSEPPDSPTSDSTRTELGESEFWLELERRLCLELRDMSDRDLRQLWCDGFVPQHYALDDNPPRILGRVWIGVGGREQFNWEFTLLLPCRVASRSEIQWTTLIPPDDHTEWLTVDRDHVRIQIEPGSAVPE